MAFLAVAPPGADPAAAAPYHSSRMVLDEDAMAPGIALHGAVAIEYLRHDATRYPERKGERGCAPKRRQIFRSAVAVDPVLDLLGKVDEIVEASSNVLMNPPRIDIQVGMYQQVAKSAQALQSVGQLRDDDPAFPELHDYVLVSLRSDIQRAAEDVIANVEQCLGGELKAALRDPLHAKVSVEALDVGLTEFLQMAQYPAQFAQPLVHHFRA